MIDKQTVQRRPKPEGQRVREPETRPGAVSRCLLVDGPLPLNGDDALPPDDASAQLRLYRAFLPLLERWAPVRQPVARQSLTDAVRQARSEGLQPICVSFAPLCAMRLSREAPNVALTAWPYHDLPSPWQSSPATGESLPMMEQLSLVVAGSRFTERAFRDAGREARIEVVVPPIADRFFDLPVWLPGSSATWNGPAYALQSGGSDKGEERWLFPVIQRAELSGIVYTAVADPADAASNWLLLIDTFLEALADRPDAVLAIKLVAEDGRDQPYLAKALQYYRTLAREHRCRVLLLPGEFTEEQSLELMAAASFQVTATRADGAPLALQAALAAGRPVLAPRHTALADYVDGEVALIVKSRPEPAQLSPALQGALTTVWYEVNRRSLIEAFRTSYDMAQKRDDYRRLSDNARRRMREICSNSAAERQLFAALAALA